jgi:hypothetical protein
MAVNQFQFSVPVWLRTFVVFGSGWLQFTALIWLFLALARTSAAAKKRSALVLSVCLGIYVLSYVVLSSFGAYAPATWGLGQHGMQPRWYSWAPPGFYNPATGEWHTRVQILYRPLWLIDDRCWHTSQQFPADGCRKHPAVFPWSSRK